VATDELLLGFSQKHVLITVAIVACLLGVCLIVLPTATAEVDSSPHINAVSYHGDGVAVETADRTFLWAEESATLTIAVSPDRESAVFVCASTEALESDHVSFGCEFIPRGTETAYVPLHIDHWPESAHGNQWISIRLYSGHGSTEQQIVDTQTVPVHIFLPEGDLSGNGLLNEQEISAGTHPAYADTDGDGLSDGLEVLLGTNPRNPYTPINIGIGLLLIVGGLVGLVSVFTGRSPLSLPSAIGSRSHTSSNTPQSHTWSVDRTPTADPADTVPPPTRITTLLEEAGGKKRQSELVVDTNWSKSKVSRVLSSMEEDDKITRIRLGREKLVCLRGHEPIDLSPPFERNQ